MRYAVALKYGSSDRYRIIFVVAGSAQEARARAYDTDRLGSIVAVASVPRSN